MSIMDHYMTMCGAPEPCNNHQERILNLALAMMMEAKSVISPGNNLPIRVIV